MSEEQGKRAARGTGPQTSGRQGLGKIMLTLAVVSQVTRFRHIFDKQYILLLSPRAESRIPLMCKLKLKLLA